MLFQTLVYLVATAAHSVHVLHVIFNLVILARCQDDNGKRRAQCKAHARVVRRHRFSSKTGFVFFLCTGYVLMFTQKHKSGTKAPIFSTNSERYESGFHAKWKIFIQMLGLVCLG